VALLFPGGVMTGYVCVMTRASARGVWITSAARHDLPMTPVTGSARFRGSEPGLAALDQRPAW
jgi:hypothetical protein